MKKLFAIVLCLAMLLSLAACGNTPTQDPDPTETSSNEEVARDLYAQARKALDEATSLTLELEILTTTQVAGNTLSRQSNQTLTYQDMGTDHAVIALDDELAYGVHLNEDADTTSYKETWYQDTLYVNLLDSYRFSGAVSAEEASARYTPAVLLDASLYGSVTWEPTNGGTKVFFAQPTAAESWAMPADATLEKASGTALLDETGALSRMDYSVTYTYGSATITTTVQSKKATTLTVTPPEKTELYPALTDVDAVLLMQDALMNVCLAENITFSSAESLTSYAAAVVRSENYQMYTHGQAADMLLKLENSMHLIDLSTGQTTESKMEQTYLDGKLTTVDNGALPSTSTMEWEIVSTFAIDMLVGDVPNPDYWQDATITDLGSLYLLEMELNENFGNTTQNMISQSLFEDPSFLLNLSSEYKNKELTGYLSVDKYTGLIVASGYYYEGVHTIEGQDFALTLQYDQSVEAPSKGAYKEITGEMLPETEPENKATPLFYHVTGEDGQEMWLLGTIHVGDERTAYLPQEIEDAFAASDALALECNTELFDQQVEEDPALAATVSALYFYTDGTTVESLMDAEEYAFTLQMLKATGNYNMNMPVAKPILWSESLDLFYLRQGYQLHRDQGVETRLMAWAEDQGKQIREVESSLFQMQMMFNWSKDLQIWMLQESAASDAAEYWQSTWELYELWCAGDEEAMRKELSSNWDASEMTEEEIAEYTPLMEEYNKSMSYDRNEGMLDVAIEYLESGDVVFYAVGLAHLLDSENGLVDTLREAGYTVELVTYAS